MKKVSCVMTTFGRYKCVERAFNCFLNQTYYNKELIIYNTDTEHPYDEGMNFDVTLHREGGSTRSVKVTVINQSIDSLTGLPYTNVGAIRRDALTHATGDYYVCWDDDDVFLPWMLQQSIDRMAATGLPSFKPQKSFFYAGNNLSLVQNTLEASVVSDINLIRKYGYLLETGKEGLGWYTQMRDHGELVENDSYYIPHYCFNWNDGQQMSAPHKQSGDIDNPNNFDNHKKASKDVVTGPLRTYSEMEINNMYSVYYDFINATQDNYPPELITKYVTR